MYKTIFLSILINFTYYFKKYLLQQELKYNNFFSFFDISLKNYKNNLNSNSLACFFFSELCRMLIRKSKTVNIYIIFMIAAFISVEGVGDKYAAGSFW